MNKLTAKQINQKYSGHYVEVYERPLWDKSDQGDTLYEIREVYSVIHENTARAEDIGTELAYTR